ncbi:CbaC protein [Halorubrum tibetense]|uniref:CbaC protein n=1 Tax=Halorubrum tibetense TaxID=175631 RepID=A0ABD5SEB0_9EURY
MTVDITRGGLYVALAVFGVILYEIRTVLDFVGVELPLIPYMIGVFVLAGVAIAVVQLKGGWRDADDASASDPNDPA